MHYHVCWWHDKHRHKYWLSLYCQSIKVYLSSVSSYPVILSPLSIINRRIHLHHAGPVVGEGEGAGRRGRLSTVRYLVVVSSQGWGVGRGRSTVYSQRERERDLKSNFTHSPEPNSTHYRIVENAKKVGRGLRGYRWGWDGVGWCQLD